MEAAEVKPRLNSSLVRIVFIQHFESQKVDDTVESRGKRVLRAMAICKEFAAITGARLHGTKLHFSYEMLYDMQNGPFNEMFGFSLDRQQTMLLLALAKPKLRELVLDLRHCAPVINERHIDCFVGIPNLEIRGKAYRRCLPLLKRMAPHLSNLVCSFKYLEYNLPSMKLETFKDPEFAGHVDFTLLFAQHQWPIS
ncbi:hypothetical protein M3Y98_00096400 [Aphelenchoides besseyi]|nr:hypothetical protein M3Y98_00096400 [Aphelenchoides besseyi]KAI6198565.1 hypothetical protein M3Y96_00532700 [Aphelenchoides besseyi]